MSTIKGKLDKLTLTARTDPARSPTGWVLELRIDKASYKATTSSWIATCELETAVVPSKKKSGSAAWVTWPVEIELDESLLPAIRRVRIHDDDDG
jgi:hypothetical protein